MVNNKAYPVIIYFGVLYYGDKRVSMIKSCIRTIKHNCLKDRLIVFTLMFDVRKMDVFCSTKYRTPLPCMSNIVPEFI